MWELENRTFPFFFFFLVFLLAYYRTRLTGSVETWISSCVSPLLLFFSFFSYFFTRNNTFLTIFFFSLLPCPDCWGEVNWGATDSSGSCDFFFLFKKKKFFYSINIWHSKKKRKEIPIRWWTRFIIRTCLVFTCRTAAGRLEAEGGQSSCTLLTYDKLKVSWSKGGGGGAARDRDYWFARAKLSSFWHCFACFFCFYLLPRFVLFSMRKRRSSHHDYAVLL